MTFFQTGIVRGKNPENLGTLWRCAYQLGADGIFTVGRRYKHQASDTVKAYRHIPLVNYETFEDFLKSRPMGVPIVGVEMGGEPLATFHHPRSGVYLLGAEDGGLPAYALEQCQSVVSIEAVRTESFNVATAGAIVMYSRLSQRGIAA